MARPIHEIAQEIQREWKRPYFGAVPYIEAMLRLNSLSDMYFADNAEVVVTYFLGNAGSWKGETARRIKAELRLLLAARNQKRKPRPDV